MDLTVIIPCFNDGGFLNRSVGSVCPQLAETDELIVVDDGSADRTASVAAALQKQFDHCRVRYVHQANAGVASARNHGLRLAEGRYVIFLDADDELLDGAITSYKQRITQDAPPWMISAHEWRVGNESSQRVPEVRGGSERLFRKFLQKQLHVGNLSCMCISRDCARRVGFFDHLRVGEDLVFLAVLMSLHPPAVVSRCNVRVHRRAAGSLRNASVLEDMVASQVFESLFSHPDLPVAYQAFRKTALIRHYRSILRQAWKQREAYVFGKWYRKLVRADPLAALDLKLLWRYWMSSGSRS